MKTYSILLITLLLCSCERDAAPLKEPEPEVPKNRLDYLIGEYEYEKLVPPDFNSSCHKYADFDNGFTLTLDSIDTDERIRFGNVWYHRSKKDSTVFNAWPSGPGQWPMKCYENQMYELLMTVNDTGFHLTNRYDDHGIREVEIHFIKKK